MLKSPFPCDNILFVLAAVVGHYFVVDNVFVHGLLPLAPITLRPSIRQGAPAASRVVPLSPVLSSSSSDILEEDGDPVASHDELENLVSRKLISPLVQAKSDWQGVFQTTWHFGLIVVAASLVPGPLSTLSMAFVSGFLFTGLHECVHRTAFRRAWLNAALAHIFGFLCLRPAAHYRYYHVQHHKYTGNRDLDSELLPGSFLDLPVDTVGGYVVYLTGIPFWIDAVKTTVQHACGKCNEIYLPTAKARRHVANEARIYFALYSSLAVLGFYVPLLGRSLMRFWVVPAILGQPFLRFYLLAEHRGRATTPVIYENTRTMATNWFYRKLAWNMPYHMEHHAWPSVPFHKLPRAHELLLNATADQTKLLGREEQIVSGETGYLKFHVNFVRKLLETPKQFKVS